VLSDTGGLGATFEGSLAALSRELIAGFSTRDLIDVTNINSASATFAYAGSGGMGVLTLRDGGQTGELYLDGNLAGGTFHLASDGRGGTLIAFH
jgi:hypothetical protein